MTKYAVKNMVCRRCILAVEDIVEKLGHNSYHVNSGEIFFKEALTDEMQSALKDALQEIGLELIDGRMNSIIEKIKSFVIKKARKEFDDGEGKIKLSVALSAALHHEYTYLSSLFSAAEGRSIEQYFIEQRIERVKELLVYDEMNLSQIALDLDYSSVAHLSNQFKKITGLTPSEFRKIGSARRKLIDEV